MEPIRFAFVTQRMRPCLLRLAAKLLPKTEDAEDAVQEALLHLWTMWAELPTEADAERMACRLTKNECINVLRSARTRRMSPLFDKETQHTAEIHADATLEEDEVRVALERAIRQLPRKERLLWEMHTEAQMGTAEIAAATAMNQKSVSAMLSAARQRIRKTLRKGGFIND